MRQFICHADEGGIRYTATAAPGPGREDRAENTRRTGGRGPGRDFSKKNLCVSARRMARRKGPGVESLQICRRRRDRRGPARRGAWIQAAAAARRVDRQDAAARFAPGWNKKSWRDY